MNAATSSLLFPLLATLAASAVAQDADPRYGAPVPGLSAGELDRFEKGLLIFNKAFTPAEGRGPNFNDESCSSCHAAPGIGGFSSKVVTRFGSNVGGVFSGLDTLGGSLLQAVSNDDVNCGEVIPPEADTIAIRITPPCFGFGLLEAIDDSEIVGNAANPNVTGVVHWVPELENPMAAPRAGRFGWKSQLATVLSFSGDASLMEMGITNRIVGAEAPPNGDLVKLAACDFVADPEDGPDGQGFDAIDRMTDFQRYLAAPPQTPRSGMLGEPLFNSIGCTDCHRASYVTKNVAEPALSNRTIKPYSDFLLHDIGTGDHIEIGAATGLEFRTTPLWGLLPRAQISLLHDASINSGTTEQNIENAILAHANEAAYTVANYNALSVADRQAVIRFLMSLGQMAFDHEQDHTVTDIDWFFSHTLFNGPTPAYTPEDFASINDVDQDGDFDLRDFGALQRAFTGGL
jgi:CxxC motif-containing protein (DUF1111 family)